MAIKNLKFSSALLTESEAECFQLGRGVQRRALINKTFSLGGFKQLGLFKELSWSTSSWRFLAQLLIYIVSLPLLLLWHSLKVIYGVGLFPFRYIATFVPPRDLSSPGEKNIQGLHHHFSGYLQLSGSDYIECVNKWVIALYGTEKAKYHNFARYLHDERRRLQEQGINDPAFLSVTVRNQTSVARSRLSRELGNYY